MQRKLAWLFFILLLSFPLFYQLGSAPLFIWDEARLGANAMEMKINHDFLVTYFDGKPDLWNTKPPFLIWLQVVFMYLFGENEWALRLPSALAALATCGILILFSVYKLRKPWIGIFASFVLVTAHGYIHHHVARSADYDALLTFFMTLQCFSFFLFVEEKKRKWWYVFVLSLTAAVLTKQTAGLFFLPGLFLFTLYRKSVWAILKNFHFYLGIIGFISCVGGYYFLREHVSPGYLHAIWMNDFGGRFSQTQEANNHPFLFYIDQLVNYQFTIWAYLIPFGIWMGCKAKEKYTHPLTTQLCIIFFTFLLIVSSAQTKLDWYIAPLFPIAAFLIGIFLNFLKENYPFSKWKYGRLYQFLSFALIIVGLTAYFLTAHSIIHPRPRNWIKEMNHMQIFLDKMPENGENLDGYYLISDEYTGQFQFYFLKLKQKNIHIRVKDYRYLEPNDKIVLYLDRMNNWVQEHYQAVPLKTIDHIRTYEIQDKKTP